MIVFINASSWSSFIYERDIVYHPSTARAIPVLLKFFLDGTFPKMLTESTRNPQARNRPLSASRVACAGRARDAENDRMPAGLEIRGRRYVSDELLH
jgi:hypothetical protein